MPAPAIVTPALLSALRAWPHLPHHVWYYVAGVTLSVLNRPDEIGAVLQHALKHGGGPPARREQTPDGGAATQPGHEEQLRIARRMREGLVKSIAVVGLPKTINALLSLKSSTPPSLLDPPQPQPPPATPEPQPRALDVSSTPSAAVLARGQALFDRLYGKISGRVMAQMDNCGAPDLGLAARLGYAYILSGGGGVLSAPETSWVLLAGLVPQDVNPQLKGHLKGALNVGASVAQVRAVRGVVVSVCEAAGMRRLGEGEGQGWGWRADVADLKGE